MVCQGSNTGPLGPAIRAKLSSLPWNGAITINHTVHVKYIPTRQAIGKAGSKFIQENRRLCLSFVEDVRRTPEIEANNTGRSGSESVGKFWGWFMENIHGAVNGEISR